MSQREGSGSNSSKMKSLKEMARSEASATPTKKVYLKWFVLKGRAREQGPAPKRKKSSLKIKNVRMLKAVAVATSQEPPQSKNKKPLDDYF